MFRKFGIIAVLSLLVTAFAAVPALAAVAPGTYTPTAGSFNSANAPGSSHLSSGTVQCVVNADRSIDCSNYVLGGVGHTNATVSLTASYSATIDCNNPSEKNRNNPIESHTSNFSTSDTLNVASSRNGQLRVPTREADPFAAPQVCPNDSWVPEIRTGTVTLNSFTYTLTFAGFSSPYITIKSP
jgi:hypothetical protein